MRMMIPQVIMSLPLTGLGAALMGSAVPNYTTSEAGNPFVDGWVGPILDLSPGS